MLLVPNTKAIHLAEDEKYGFQEFRAMAEKDEFQTKGGKFPA